MTDILKNTSLDTKVFGDELDFKTLENILETLDYVEARKISRQNFNNLKGNFLVENGQDKKGEQKYILYLPEDLKQFELAYIIDFLTTKFNIQDYANIEEIINKTKIAVSVVLRQEGGEKYLKELVEDYSIPKDFVEKVKTTKLNFGETRKFIKEVKSKRNKPDSKNIKNKKSKNKKSKNKKLGEEKEDLENIFSETQKLYSQEFDLTFFRKGINMLRLGMETLTQAELQAKIKYLEENGFKKEEKYGQIYYTKGKEKVVIENDLENFDKKERLLRDKIGIEEFKNKLEKARIEGDQEKINQLELEASNKIIETLYNTYPYYVTKEYNGYQANKIKEFKEVFCLGFSLLGHAFLSELKIKHNGLDIPVHSALEVIIGGKKYYFDASTDNKLYKYNYSEKDKVGVYFKNKLTGNLLQPGDPEKIMLSHILNNKGYLLLNIGKYKESIMMFNKAIGLNPKYALAYKNKGNSLFNLGKYKESIKMYDKAIKLNPKDASAYNNKCVSLYELKEYKLLDLYEYTVGQLRGIVSEVEIKKEVKQEIDDFIEKKDYEGLRKYLLELEKEED